MPRFLSLSEAVAALVSDGMTLVLEGFTHLIPFAAGHEIIRQGRRDQTLTRMTPDLIYDRLIGMGCARKLVFSWGGNPGVGSLHRLRDAVEHGWPRPLEIEEHSHAAMANAYHAGAAGLPCALFKGYDGSDLIERLGLRTLGPILVITDLCVMKPDPVSKELTVVALHPGVTQEQVQANTGWAPRFATALAETEAPTDQELAVLRDLQARTARAHGMGQV